MEFEDMTWQKQPVRPRIREILLMLAKGHKEPYIAYRLGLKLITVSSYMTDIRQLYQLGQTHAEMIQTALDRGLISQQELEKL